MNFSQKDIEETRFVGALIKSVNDRGLTKASEIADSMVKNQPFMMSLLIGYKFDVEEDQLNDIMKMLFVIYLFFEQKTNISRRQIDLKEFKKHEKKNSQFLQYFSGELTSDSQLEVNKEYLSNLRFKSLFTGILAMFKTQASLRRMSLELKAIIALGMKTLIDCLESNLPDKK